MLVLFGSCSESLTLHSLPTACTSSITLEFSLWRLKDPDLVHSTTCTYLILPAPFVEMLFFLCFGAGQYFCLFVKNWCVDFHLGLHFYSIDQHISFCVNTTPFLLLSLYNRVYTIRNSDTSKSSFTVTDCFSYHVFVCFLMMFKLTFSISVKKKCVGIFIGIIQICVLLFSRMAISVLILPIYEHGRSFHLLMSVLVSFFNVSRLDYTSVSLA